MKNNQEIRQSKIIHCLFAMMLCSCTLTGNLYDDDNGNNGNNGNNDPDPHVDSPKMTLILNKTNVVIGISGSGSVTIDWGDGSPVQTQNLSVNFSYFTYSIFGARAVTISGENITRLDCSDNQVSLINVSEMTTLTHLFCSDNQLTNLNVNNNNLLELLLCNNNSLTSLNVSANTALKLLDAGFNNMQGAALNTLLTSLHGNTISDGKTVLINNNTGTASQQNINTAINKGWEVIK